MAGENPFLKAYSGKGAFQTSSLDDLPQYSVLSLDVPEGEEDKSLLQLGFDEDSPISEVAPAENSAQRWDRQADALHDQISNVLKPMEPRKGGFFHTYNEIFNQKGLGRPQVADILGLRGNSYLRAFGRIDARATPSKADSTGRLSDADFHAQFQPQMTPTHLNINERLPTSEQDWRKSFPHGGTPPPTRQLPGNFSGTGSGDATNLQYAV